MGLMLALLVALLAVTAAVIATAALRNGVATSDDAAGELAERISRQRRHIAEATGAHPPHRVR